MRYSLYSLVFLAACSDATALGPVAPDHTDREPPVLELRTPLRGSLQPGDATTVDVRGFVFDDSAVTVTVNGRRARVNGDGSFAMTVPATPGITLVQTTAIDARRNQRRDTRAVLGGALVDASAPVGNAVVARLDARAVAAGGAGLARRLAASDLGAALARRNPLHHNVLPCIGSRADLDRLTHRVVRLDAAPVHGGLRVDVELADLAFGLRVAFGTSCQEVRSADVTAAAARFQLRGVVRLALAGGRVAVDTADASAWLDGLRLDAAALPARVAAELEAALVDALTARLVDELAGRLPSLLLPGLGADEGGGGLALRPTQLDLDDGGVTLAVSSAAPAAAAGAPYLPRSTQRPAVEGRAGLAVGIADDALNQLLAAAWAAGRLDRVAAGVELSPRLPPQLATLADGRLRLIAGDVEARLVDSAARLAVTLDTTLEPRVVDGRLAVAAAAPLLFVDRLDGAAAPAPGAGELVAGEVLAAVSAALAELPLPAAPGAMTVAAQRDPFASGAGGYLVVTAE